MSRKDGHPLNSVDNHLTLGVSQEEIHGVCQLPESQTSNVLGSGVQSQRTSVQETLQVPQSRFQWPPDCWENDTLGGKHQLSH